MVQKQQRQRKYFAPQNDKEAHVCDYPGCKKAGEYRAPKDRRLKDYYWFCLEHVQQYNAGWNYYADETLDSEEPFKNKNFRFSSRVKYQFGFDFDFGYNIFDGVSYEVNTPPFRITPEERQGLKMMEIELEDLTKESLKKAYKKAVKKYHPDLNKNDRLAEENFKIISTTYKALIQKIS